MPIFASNFTTNSLSGSFVTADGHANISLISVPYALEGNKSFVIKIRKGSTSGDVIATTSPITLTDNSSFVSLTANTATVNEGDLVSFSLVTANAINNSNIYFSVFPVTSNVTIDDFVGNVGVFSIINNVGTFALRANTDLSVVNETGENFRVQIRTNAVNGNVVYTSSNIAIADTSNAYNIIGLVAGSASPIVSGSNVTFTFTATNVPTGTLFYYSTTGNVTSFSSNTGSFALNSTSNTLVIANPQVPFAASRAYNVIVRSSSASGPIVATSDTINVLDAALVTMSASGGVQSNISGYRIHTFTTSGSITFSKSGAVEYLIVGGGGGGYPKGGGGGGGGLLLSGSNDATPFTATGGTPYSIVIGAGGSTSTQGTPSTGFGLTAYGGGRGTLYGGVPGPEANGGSGGGGSSKGKGVYPGSPYISSPRQGYDGGTLAGGGAGGAGSPVYAFDSGNGPGLSLSFTGSPYTYSAGGTGGNEGSYYTGPGATDYYNTGGYGAGGTGAYSNPGGGFSGPGFVAVKYSTDAAAFVNITTPTTFVYEGSNVVFTLSTTNVANNTLLYYYTVGNILSSHFVTGNTGSFRTTQNSTNITLPTNSTIPSNEEKFFQLRIAGDTGTSQDPLITSNVFTVKDSELQPKATSIQYLVVAGGAGGGGQNGGGGGGAGGYLANSAYPITPATPYTITVGAGGNGAPSAAPPYSDAPLGGVGSNSLIGAGVVAFGGGGGGSFYGRPLYFAGPGGSGGGSLFANGPSNPVNAGLAIGSPAWNVAGSQGYPGGRSSSPNGGSPISSGGGGGGAGGTGADGGTGGIGLQTSISGSATYYAGGGGGSGQGPSYPGGLGGGGGGGGGSPTSNGTTNTGGGGAGCNSTGAQGGNGGAGIVVIRYPDTFATATTTGSPNVIYANANIIYRFWQSGTITFP